MLKFDDNQLLVFNDRFKYVCEEDGIEEKTPHDTFNRVATILSSKEAEPSKWYEKFMNVMEEGLFCPAGRILANAGTRNNNCFNCFVLPIEDNLISIFESIKEMAIIQSRGGGTGWNFSTLRPKGDRVKGTNNVTTGVCSFISAHNDCSNIIESGSRRAANMALLDISHPEIEDFIKFKKLNPGKWERFNVSVVVNQAFFECVDRDGDWELKFGGKVYRTVKAKELWRLVCEYAWMYGDPGIIDLEFANTDFNYPLISGSPVIACNPCHRGDQRLLTDMGWRTFSELRDQTVNIYDGSDFVEGEVWATGYKSTIRVNLSNGKSVVCTPDHRILTLDGWVEARNSLGKTVQNTVVDSKFETDMYGHVTEDIAEVCGFIHGDGNVRKDKVCVYYTPSKDGEYISKKLDPIMREITAPGDSSYEPCFSKTKNVIEYCRSRVFEYFSNLGMSTSTIDERLLPSFVWKTSALKQRAFIRGLFGANGNVLNSARNGIVLVSINKAMLNEVQLLLQSLGINSAVRRHNKASEVTWSNGTYTSKESFHLEIVSGGAIQKFVSDIGFPQDCQNQKMVGFSNIKPRPNHISKATVVSIEVEDEHVEVYDFKVPSTNMGIVNGILTHNCSEKIMHAYDQCDLGSVNVFAHVKNPESNNPYFDWDLFGETIDTAVRLLDNVYDVSDFPLPRNKAFGLAHRRIGVGIMGYADALMTMGIKYSESKAFCQQMMDFMANRAFMASTKLAKEKSPNGINPDLYVQSPYIKRVLKPEIIEHIKTHGIRNMNVLAMAPTGTIALFYGVSSGVEPVFNLQYSRKDNLTGEARTYFHPVFEKCKMKSNFNTLWQHGVFETALDLTPEQHLEIHGTFAPYVDSNISKTVNLAETASIEDVDKAFRLARSYSIKSTTVFRTGSRNGVLSPIPIKMCDKCNIPLQMDQNCWTCASCGSGGCLI